MTETNPPARIRASDAERDQVLTVLQQGYETGRLDLVEMQERQDKVLGARYLDELPVVVADLPQGDALATVDSAPLSTRPIGLPETANPDGGFLLSIMSGKQVTVESGTRELRGFALWGGNDIDLTRAMGPGRIVTLKLHAWMGGNNVYVPAGVRIIDRSFAIMAGTDVQRSAQGDGSNGTLVLEGLLLWGGNDVKLADGESQ